MEATRADAREATVHLNTAVHSVGGESTNVGAILKRATSYLRAVIENQGGGIPDRMAAQALDLIYAAEALLLKLSIEQIQLARNKVHDVVIRTCVRTLASPHDKDGLLKKFRLAFGRHIDNKQDNQMYTRLLHAKSKLFGEVPNRQKRRRPGKPAAGAERVAFRAATRAATSAIVYLGDVAYLSFPLSAAQPEAPEPATTAFPLSAAQPEAPEPATTATSGPALLCKDG